MKNISIVHNMKTNIICQNGNINIGSAVQNSHTSNLKVVGTAFSFGDCSSANEAEKEINIVEIQNSKGEETEDRTDKEEK
ncbi:spore germination protein [Metabacillus fastidiosus]|uniref:spore germination protein n=1 Tax=Metabacillus fastidiosus TaxID=1458 RepID=UPI002E2282AB|nr:spore germination protein [Metabacillus fastidiosus]